MADFSKLIKDINAVIKENGRREITGQILQDVLVAMVESINEEKQDPTYGFLLNEYNPYLYEILCTNLDYEYAKEHINEIAEMGSCSAFHKDGKILRNFDWKYDERTEFIVRTKGVIGISSGVFNRSEIDYTSERAKLLPFALVDGVNSRGLYANVNVVSTEYGTGDSQPAVELRETVPALMLVRYILDNFSTAREAVEYIRDYVTIQMNGKGLHWLVTDKEGVAYTMEVIEGAVVIEEHDVLTNFHWYGVQTNADGTLYGPERPAGVLPTEANGLTPYASGIERYNVIISNPGKSLQELAQDLMYSRAYTGADWYSEFVGGDLTVDSMPSDFANIIALARQAWIQRDRETAKVWHTLHSCVYDLENKTISIVSQDGDVTIGKFPINVALQGIDYDKLIRGLVHYDIGQTLSDTQKGTARSNIGAMGFNDFNQRAVRFDQPQTLTEPQQAQARQNIGAISTEQMTAAILIEKQRAEAKEGELHNEILTEQGRAEDAEAELSARIDAIVQGRDVRDIVPNYQALLDYDTTTLGDNDIIMVLLDNTKSDHTTYYRWHTDTQSWEFIGGLAFTYTKTEIDEKFADLHIVLPVFNEQSSQELLAQVDETIRHADAQFKLPIPVEGMSGNVAVTYVKFNPMHTYLGVFADDRSELYHITRTLTTPRTYTCEVITKVFAAADALAQLIKDLYNADPEEGEEKGDIVKLREELEGKQDIDKMQTTLTESNTNYPSSNAVITYVGQQAVFKRGTGTNSVVQEGLNNVASGVASMAVGYNNIASGLRSHAEGNRTRAGMETLPNEDVTSTEGIYTHAEGNSTLARGSASHAEGAGTQSLGRASHAEGRHSIASGNYSHAEGFDTFAGNNGGQRTPTSESTMIGYFTHAEGHNTLAQGNSSHAEGKKSKALGEASHAEGFYTHSIGVNSHAEGYYTKANNQEEHSEGRYNVSHKASDNHGDAGNTVHSVGIGTSDTGRKNAHEIMQNGDHYIFGVGGYVGLLIGGNVKTLQQVINSHDSAILTDKLTLKAGTFDTNKAVYDLLTATPHLAKLVVYLNTTTNTYYNLNTWKKDGNVFRFSYLREDGDTLVVTRFSLDANGKVS